MVLPHQLIHALPIIRASLSPIPHTPHTDIYLYFVCLMSPTLCVLCGSLSLPPTHRQVLLMDSTNVGSHNHLGGTEPVSRTDQLQEGILLLLSRWYALQMAVKNHWGGSDSLQKSHQLAADIFSLFSRSNAPVPVEDLENLLHESMLLIFNTEIEDGSIEEASKWRYDDRGSHRERSFQFDYTPGN